MLQAEPTGILRSLLPLHRLPAARQNRRRGAVGALLLAALLLTAILLALAVFFVRDTPPASAAPTALVSNASETEHSSRADLSATRTGAQSFQTGSNSGGYALWNIEVKFDVNLGRSARDGLRAQVWSNHDSGYPETKLHDLTTPAHPINAGTVSFTAPAGPKLAADTTYWVVIYSAKIDNGLETTSSADQTGATGWSIGDAFRFTSDNPPTASSTWTAPDTSRAWLMAVNGNAIPVDYDTDDDGLIEVFTSDQLDAIRHDPDGDGTHSGSSDAKAEYPAAFPHAAAGMGCPETGCAGYELASNLNMAHYNFWPVSGYSATLEGNGHAIANLCPRSSHATGMFSVLNAGSEVRNLTLKSVCVVGPRYGYGENVGGLAGINHGAISNVHVSGYAAAHAHGGTGPVGGLVGLNGPTGVITDSSSAGTSHCIQSARGRDVGGLVGRNEGSIRSSYSTARVWGAHTSNMSGLVGYNASTGSIRASYATGDVRSTYVHIWRSPYVGRHLGGLVGTNEGEITASYSTGPARGGAASEIWSGMVGRHLGGAITNSYWDTQTSRGTSSAGGVGRTTAQLQQPTDYTGIYANWNVDLDGDGTADDPWDFGSATEYPRLKKAADRRQLQGSPPQRQASGDYSELIAQMKEWRNDPQWVSEKAHTDRWDRALMAFGETVADKTLTAMTATEAQGYADKGSAWSRWVEVAKALQEIEAAGQQNQQQGTPNRAPTVSSAIGDATIVNESGTMQVSLTGVFSDADNDSLTVTAASDDTAVATVSVAADGSSLTVTTQSRGTATITVTADDGNGGTVSDTFTVTVKAAPVVASAIGDVTGLEVDGTQEVSLAGVFSDALTITATSSDETKATVSVVADYSTLTLAGLSVGTATITVTAQDSDSNTVSDAFQVSVVGKYAALIAQMKEWRNDPQWKDHKSHTDRWDRALKAFGETVADTTLTDMTAAEAQGYADQSWGVRWVPVAAALWKLQNRAPTVAAAIADATIVNESGTQQVSLTGVFSDADGDRLTITAASSNAAVATVSVASDGSSLTVTAQSRGVATITATAADGNGGSVEDAFTVTVKAAPTVAAAIGDVSGLEVDASQDISLTGVFSDADGDSLTITVASSDEDVVSAYEFSGTLTILGAAAGSETITVTAQDTDGNTVSDTFDVSVVAAQQQTQQAAPNRAPTVSNAISDATIVNESGTKQVSLTGVFSDADNDALTIRASSSDATKATVSVATDGSSLTVNAQARGSATITVTASDGNGGTVADTFTVTVKAAPVVASAIADVSGLEVGDTQDVSLAGVFRDADGDSLTITAASSDETKATVTVASDGSKLTLSGVAEGTTTITVTARDADGNTVSDAFDVSVEPEPEQAEAEQPAPAGTPTVVSPLADLSLEVAKYRLVSLSGVFSDPDGDDLTLRASASNYSVVSMSKSGSTLIVVGKSEGRATITVTAEDGDGNTVSDAFEVTVRPES